jgi:Cu/Ag efflux protein CusF
MKNPMNKLIAGTLGALLALSAAAVLAQTPNADGEVNKIDKPHARITLKHGGVRNLDMPPMVLIFRVRDPAVLDTLAVGDKVRFAAEKIDGNFTLTVIVKMP